MCAVAAVERLSHPRGWIVALPFALGTIWLLRQSRRDRCQPYVEVIEGQLVVHSSHRASKQVDMRLLRRVRRGWNKTILVLKDGTQVSIDHGLFTTSSEAQRFREFMEEGNGDGPA